jgi:hypothetical protein
MRMLSAAAVVVGMFLLTPLSARAATLNLMVQSDFALFGGTGSEATRLVYQNGVGWGSQSAAASGFIFDLLPGETHLYLAAFGGGIVGGYLNNFNIWNGTILNESPDISGYLTGYGTSGAAIQNGTYQVVLEDVLNAMENVTFGVNPQTSQVFDHDETPDGKAFAYQDRAAILYRIDPTQVGMAVVPEPSVLCLCALGGLGLCSRRQR